MENFLKPAVEEEGGSLHGEKRVVGEFKDDEFSGAGRYEDFIALPNVEYVYACPSFKLH